MDDKFPATQSSFPSASRMRLAIISTPRSGNTWLRELLGRIYAIPQVPVHFLTDDDWRRLPDECILQMHWRVEPAFLARLREEGFRVLTVARHPFDVLISILHFTIYSDTSPWLRGAGGDESSLYGATPRSRAFVSYAASPRARELFAVTSDWWNEPETLAVRYENMVADPHTELQKIAETIGPIRGVSFHTAIEETSVKRLNLTCTNNHFWQGRPGLWRDLLPENVARELSNAVQAPLTAFGYAVDPVSSLTDDQADANWVRYFGNELIATVRRSTETQRTQIQGLSDALALAQERCARLEETIRQLNDEALHLREQQRLITGLGGFAIDIAHGIQRAINRFPHVARIVRRLRRH